MPCHIWRWGSHSPSDGEKIAFLERCWFCLVCGFVGVLFGVVLVFLNDSFPPFPKFQMYFRFCFSLFPFSFIPNHFFHPFLLKVVI